MERSTLRWRKGQDDPLNTPLLHDPRYNLEKESLTGKKGKDELVNTPRYLEFLDINTNSEFDPSCTN
jgi:hypothetical protein